MDIDRPERDELLAFIETLLRAAKMVIAYGDGWVIRRRARRSGA